MDSNNKLFYVHLDYSRLLFGHNFRDNGHTSSEIPYYWEHSRDQSSRIFDEVTLLTDLWNSAPIDTDAALDEIENVKREEATEIERSSNLLYDICSEHYPSFYRDAFWFCTLSRLLIVLDYVVDRGIEKFYHMEYDNVVYGNPNFIDKLPKGIYFSQVGPGIGSAGFMCSNDLQATEDFRYQLLELLYQGQNFLASKLKTTHLYEMEMIDYLVSQHEQFRYLPLFPSDDLYEECGYVFDGASYGQFLGGTNQGHPAGHYEPHHHFGRRMAEGGLSVDYNDHNPTVTEDGIRAPIFNLHVHNKSIIREFNPSVEDELRKLKESMSQYD